MSTTSPSLVSNVLTPEDTKYILERAELEAALRKRYPHCADFKISTKNNRWMFRAPEKVPLEVVKEWVADLDTQRKAQQGVEAARPESC